MISNESGLFIKDINKKNILVLDPDNVFWGLFQKNNGHPEYFLPHELISLYSRMNSTIQKELDEFRFSANLSAVYIDTTDRCNANCPYCYIPYNIRKHGKSMNYQELEYILKKIVIYFKDTVKKPVIIFHASEPLITKDIIFKAIPKFSNKFKFGLQTNAILLKKQDVDFLKKYRVGVGISLDSHNIKTNNKSRANMARGSNFSHAIKAIDWFKGYAGLNVITTITKLNLKQLPELVEFLHSKKVPCVLMNPVRLTQERANKIKPNIKSMVKYFIKAVDKSIELSKKTPHRIIIGNFSNILLGITAPTARRLMCDISPCGGGRCFLTITAWGEMVPCGEFRGLKGFSGGNIYKTSIEQAMASKPFRKIRARFVEKIDKCNSCVWRNICGAPCPAELHSRGNIFKKSVFCDFYKRIIEYAFKLISKGEEKYLLRKDALGNLRYRYKL